VDVDRVVSGQGGHVAVRSLLLGEGQARLEDMLDTMLGLGALRRPCRLRRAHFKPGRKLTAIYDVPGHGRASPHPVAVTWSLRGTPADSEEQLVGAEARLRAHGVTSSFERLWALDSSMGMRVLASPLDPAFPALAELSVPGMVSGLLPRGGPFAVQPVRYRPGERHVLEYRASGQPCLFAKLYRPGEGGAVAAKVTAVSDLLDTAATPGVTAVRPAKVLAGHDAILYAEVGGTPLSCWLGRGRPTPERALRQAGSVLRAVHAVVPAPGSSIPERDLETEARRVDRACQAIATLRPALGTLAASVVARAQERLIEAEHEPATLVHGDLKADHIVVSPESIVLLDTDRSGCADPALDLGKLLADLRWWSWSESGAETAPGEAHLLAGYGDAGPRLDRAYLYAALLLVKMAARRIPLARRDWGSRTARLLAVAERALERRDAS
jgi:hypothetical protein